MTDRIPADLRNRRKPAAASKWLVAAASVGGGLGLVAGFAAANTDGPSAVAEPAVVNPVSTPAPQVVVVRVPSGGETPATATAEPTVVRIPRAVPAQSDQQPTSVATRTSGS